MPQSEGAGRARPRRWPEPWGADEQTGEAEGCVAERCHIFSVAETRPPESEARLSRSS